MAFQIKDFASITASAINWMRVTTKKVSDFNIGSIVRTMLEAIAQEIDQLYQQMWIGLREAIPVSVYNSFNFQALAAIPANGLMRETITSSGVDVVVSAGTRFASASTPVVYTTTADTVIPAGDTFVDIPVVASVAGVVGNISSGLAFTPTPAPQGHVSATNPAPFLTGQDAETEDQRKIRFNAFIASLDRGTLAAIEYGLKTVVITDSAGNAIERVVFVAINEPWVSDNTQPVAWVQCYIHNGAGATSDALLARAVEVLYGYTDANGKKVAGWRAAGVQVDTLKASEQVTDVIGVLTARAGYSAADLRVEAANAISNYINALPIGAKIIYAELISAAMEIEGVYNFAVSSPGTDVTVTASTKPVGGTITIT